LLHNELLRVETALRMEIKDLWHVFNDQQAKTLKIEKSRGMRFAGIEQDVVPKQTKPRSHELLEKLRRDRHGN